MTKIIFSHPRWTGDSSRTRLGLMSATPLPKKGDVFFDARGSDRALRLSRHPGAGVVVLSIWNGGVCQGTFRLPADQAAALAEALCDGAYGGRPPLPQTGEYHPPPAVPGTGSAR